jgi:dethiobiotin synthetase
LVAKGGGFCFPFRELESVYFITGTDTGVGKTVLTALLVGFLRARGVNAAALKPVCSGGRADARALRAAMGGALSLDEINPWHFRAPLAPLLAARHERKHLRLAPILSHLHTMKLRFDVLLVEGAGGLLSPLGENFDSGDLMAALGATPLIAAPNRLGAINHVLLTLDALPPNEAGAARVVLMAPPRPDAATRTNAALLAELVRGNRIFTLPWLDDVSPAAALPKPAVRRTLGALLGLERKRSR